MSGKCDCRDDAAVWTLFNRIRAGPIWRRSWVRAVGTRHWERKAPWPSNARWPERALGPAETRDGSAMILGPLGPMVLTPKILGHDVVARDVRPVRQSDERDRTAGIAGKMRSDGRLGGTLRRVRALFQG